MIRNISRIVIISCRRPKSHFWDQHNRMTTHTMARTDQNLSSPVLISAASIFSIFNIFKKDDPEEDSELIKTIKRSILCIQRGEYQKAEQILHIGRQFNFQIFNTIYVLLNSYSIALITRFSKQRCSDIYL